MKYPRALRAPTFWLTMAIVLGIAGVYLSDRQLTRALDDQQRAQAELGVAESQLARAREARDLAGRYREPYRALVDEGFVGADARLAWLDALTLAQRESGIAPFDYELAPRSAIPRPGTPAVKLSGSEMRVRMGLLHEGELLRFLERLKSHARGRYHVSECVLTRIARHTQPINQPTLEAECLILWFAVDPQPRPRP